MEPNGESTRGPRLAEVACAFCGEGVEPTDDDPIGLGVVERWRPYDEAIDWMVYAHRRCLLDRLSPDNRELHDE